MKRHAFCLATVLAGATAFATPALGLDWPQWQGPDRNAVSKERGLLQQWPKEGPPLAWRITGIGSGYSAPSIAASRIIGMSNRGADEVVWALSEADGKELWVTRIAAASTQGLPQGKEGAGCTPTVDGERLYVLGQSGDLACLQASDGKVVWQCNLTKDFGGRVPTWRYNESPLVDGDKLVCTPGGEDTTLVALDKLTGKPLWKSKVPDATDGTGGQGGAAVERPGGAGGPGTPIRPGGFGMRDSGRGGRGGGSGAGYSSPIAIDFGGQRQYVQLTANALVGVAASDGKLLWRYDRPANSRKINCSTPLHHAGKVFAASAYGNGGGMVRLNKQTDGGVTAEEAWFSKDMENHHGGMVVVDGSLYGANGGNSGGYLVCLDWQSGKVLWNERDPDKRRAPKGSPAVADGRIYYRTEDGAVLLIEPSPKEYLERGRFEQPDRTRQPAWTHPVIANGKLYIRDQDLLLCYQVKAAGN